MAGSKQIVNRRVESIVHCEMSAIRRFLRSDYGRRIVVALILIAGIELYPVFQIVNAYQRERRVARQIEAAGGMVEWQYFGPYFASFDVAGVCPLFNRVTDVDFLECDIPAGLLQIMRKLTRLRSLGAIATQIGDAELEHVLQLPGLVTLVLDQTRITDAGLEQLAERTSLETLSLGGTQVSDAGLVHLARLTNLRSLSLYATQITDPGFSNLSSLVNLERLDLGETAITDASVPLIVKLKKIHWLNLGGTRVTPDVGRSIKWQLSTCGNFGIVGLESDSPGWNQAFRLLIEREAWTVLSRIESAIHEYD